MKCAQTSYIFNRHDIKPSPPVIHTLACWGRRPPLTASQVIRSAVFSVCLWSIWEADRTLWCHGDPGDPAGWSVGRGGEEAGVGFYSAPVRVSAGHGPVTSADRKVILASMYQVTAQVSWQHISISTTYFCQKWVEKVVITILSSGINVQPEKQTSL